MAAAGLKVGMAQLADWFFWWRDEMASLLAMGRSSHGLNDMIRLSRDQVTWTGPEGTQSFPDLEACLSAIFASAGTASRVDLILDPSQCLVRPLSRLRLPHSFANNAARLDCATQTPIKPADVRLFTGTTKDGQATAYAMVRLRVLDGIRRDLAAAGLPIRSVVFEGSDQSLQFAFDQVFGKPAGIRAALQRGLVAALVIAALGLAGSAWVILDHGVSLAEAGLADQIARAEPGAKRARRLIGERDAHRAALRSVREALSREPTRLSAIAALSDALPDSAHIADLTLSGTTMSVIGQAPEPAELIGELEASPAFAEVHFNEAVVMVPGQEGRRFNVGMTLVPP